MSERKIEVCLTPALLHLHDIKHSVVVVIDIFRATSSICYGIENGAEAIIPVASVEICNSYSHTPYLLAAERNGQVVDGFNFGNSPFSYTKEKVNGKTVVLTTTNGTFAINESRQASRIIIGSFLNLSAICAWLDSRDEDILLLCSGWKNNVNLEDTLFAGAVIDHLKENNYRLDDAGIVAADLYKLAKHDLPGYLKKSSHSERLRNLGIEKDIEFCLCTDLTTAIPVLDGDRLVRLRIE